MNIEDLDIYKKFANKFTDNKQKALDGLNRLKNILDTESKETSEMLEIYRINGEILDMYQLIAQLIYGILIIIM